MTVEAAAHDNQHALRGIVFCLCGVFIFAFMDTMTKYLVARYPAPLVVAVRYVVHCFLMLLVLAPTQGRQLVQTQRTGMVLLRAACLAAGSLFVTLALQRMPVAETSAIVFMVAEEGLAAPAAGERTFMAGTDFNG